MLSPGGLGTLGPTYEEPHPLGGGVRTPGPRGHATKVRVRRGKPVDPEPVKLTPAPRHMQTTKAWPTRGSDLSEVSQSGRVPLFWAGGPTL